MTSQISGMNKLKNKRTGVLVSFTRLRHVTSPISVKTPPLASASRVRVMTRCACPTSVTMLSPPPSERPRHRLHFLDAHLPPRVLQEDLVERGMRERDLMDGDLLRVESPQDLEQRPAAVGRVGGHALVEDRCAAHAGDGPRDLEGPAPTLLERLVAGDPDRDDVRADRGLQLRGTSLGDDLAQVDDRDALAELVRLFHVLGRQEDRHVLLRVKATQILPHRDPRLRVEAGRGLVQEQDSRVVHEAGTQVEPPPHPARVRVGPAVRGVLQLQDIEELLDALLNERVGHVIEPPDQPEVLTSREVSVDPDRLSRVADDAPDLRPIALDIEARDVDGAARLREERRDDPDDRRLSGPVGPEETEELALAHGEADVVDGLDLLLAAAPVDLDEVTDIDHRVLHGSRRADRFLAGGPN